MSHLAVTALFVPKPDARDDVGRVLRAMVEPTRGEAGCLQYDLYEHENGFQLFERCSDREAITAHQATDHYRAYRLAVADLLEEPIQVVVGSPMDVA